VDRVATIPVAIALGSNLGDRRGHLIWAFEQLGAILGNIRVSTVRETDPVGVPDTHPPFLNAVAVGETTLSAPALLAALLDLERRQGRERLYRRSPRTLDLDLIRFGGEVLVEQDLKLPHPRFRERRFVLEPLAELAADWVDPVTGKAVGELLEALG
jgi:2-amino-4-hydroxy-6-hydroxymethyldihydropteridine diphosphokinase